jgi:hypothetical protein
MPQPKFVVAIGTIDGANTIFYTGEAYQPGSTAVFLNGQLKRHDYDDGWTETDPAAGRVDLKIPPKGSTGLPHSCCDVVQIFFLDTSPVVAGEELTPLFGTIEAVEELEGYLVDESLKHGVVEEMESLAGVIVQEELQGVVEDTEQLHGTIAEVC